MKNRVSGFAAVIMALVMILPMLTACNNSKSEPAITVEVDGEQIVIDNAEGKTIAELLEENKIVLKEGDVLAIDADQNAEGNLTVKVLRKCNVTVEVEGEDLHYTAVLVGGTVADAIDAVGITLSEDQTVNFKLDNALEDGMSILISTQESDDDDHASSSNSKSSGSGTKSSKSGSKSSSSGTSDSAPSEPSSSATSSGDNSDSGSGRSLVGSDDYPDPDGSGHGVRVETYSDGSQVEVEY